MKLARNGRTLQYDVSGEGADVIIFIPALGATRAMWQPQLPAFQPDFTVVVYDPAGHDPASIYPTQPSMAALVDAVHSRRPHVVGLSIGGMIAQEYAIRYPDRVTSLVLASTTSRYPDEARRAMEQRAAQVEQQGMTPIVEGRLEQWVTAEYRRVKPDIVAWVRGMLESADPRAYAQAARAVASLDTTDKLPAIACPALVLEAEQDTSVPSGSGEVLAAHIRNARLERIANASHLCNVENPDAFNSRVARFVRGVMEASPGEAGIPGLP